MPSATDAMLSYDDSSATAWDPLVGTISRTDGFLDLEGRHVLDVVGSNDFLSLNVDLELEQEPDLCELSSAGSGWETMKDEEDELVGPELQTLPSLFRHGFPRTPSSSPLKGMVCDDHTHQITPEKQKPSEVSLPDVTELQIQYQRTLKKLTRSMQRSDETRSIVKRQRLCSSAAKIYKEGENDFFSSPQAKAIEEAREKLYEVLSVAGDWPKPCSFTWQ